MSKKALQNEQPPSPRCPRTSCWRSRI